MKIGGILEYSGRKYFIFRDENTTTVQWAIVSPKHPEDIKAEIQGLSSKHEVLTERTIQKRKVDEDYILGSVRFLKASGTLRYYKDTLLCETLASELALAETWQFSETDTIMDQKDSDLVETHTFSARDNKLSFAFQRVNGFYHSLQISRADIKIDLNKDFKFNLPKKIIFEESKVDTLKRDLKISSVQDITFEKLQDKIDLSWYIENGVVKKDYSLIQNVFDFENLVINKMLDALIKTRENNEEFVLALDVETTGLIFYNLSKDNETLDRLVAISLSWAEDQGVLICVDMEYHGNVDVLYAIERIKSFITDNMGRFDYQRRKIVFSTKDLNESSLYPSMFSRPELHEGESLGDHLQDLYDNVENNSNIHTLNSYDENFSWMEEKIVPFDRKEVVNVAHNALFEGRVFYHYGIGTYWVDDTLDMSFVINPRVGKGSVALKNLSHRIFKVHTPELSDVVGKGNEDMFRWIKDPLVAMIYGCADSDYARKLQKYLKSLMFSISPTFYKTYQEQDMDLLPELYKSEYFGMRTDFENLVKDGAILENDRERVSKFLKDYVGQRISIENERQTLKNQLKLGIITEEEYLHKYNNVKADSSYTYDFELTAAGIRDVIYSKLKYPIKGFTKSETRPLPATDKVTMKKLQSYKLKEPIVTLKSDLLSTDGKTVLIEAEKFNSLMYPVAYVLSVYADLTKDYTGYYKPIMTTNMEGRLFKSYSLARIETRRIVNPAQTLKSALKRLVLSHSDTYYLVAVDQSQIELRIMASDSDYTDLIIKMADPEKDFHTEVASMVHGIEAHKVTKKLRKETKSISFGIPYGIGPNKLTIQLYGELTEANKFKTRLILTKYYKANEPLIKLFDGFKEEVLQQVDLSPEMREFLRKDPEEDISKTKYGKITGWQGFYRLFDITDLTDKTKGDVQRPAGNYPIQNKAAEIFRKILKKFAAKCREYGIYDKVIWHMLVHDELLFSAHNSVHPILLYKVLYKSMVFKDKKGMKYFVGINIGDNWAECKNDESEAPMRFVEQMIKRYDSGELVNDDYLNEEFVYKDSKGRLVKLKGVKAYIEKHKREYIRNRVGEVLENCYPKIKNGTIDIAELLENFTNYTVRSYIDMFYQPNCILTEDLAQEKNEDKLYVKRFETWLLEYYGEGRSVKYSDGTVTEVYRHPETRLLSKEELELLPLEDFLSTSAMLDELEDETDDSNWEFGEEGLMESDNLSYYDSVYTDNFDEDPATTYVKNLDKELSERAENSSSVAVALKEEPVYESIRVTPKLVEVSLKSSSNIQKVFDFLQPDSKDEGVRVFVKSPITQRNWRGYLSKDYDFTKLDDFVKGL